MVPATMRIPQVDLQGLRVVPYRGSPDDGPGTRIQNHGVAATPIGVGGGVGPGQVGNYIVTAHRTTSPAPFADLPALRRGDHVFVRAAGRVFDYRVTRTQWTSFRSRRSLAEQSAAVPGHPGAEPTRAMVTLSTCATPEDHARGNYWSDRFGNPEHRIEKIGVLVDVRKARMSASDGRSGG
jgi:sortase A